MKKKSTYYLILPILIAFLLNLNANAQIYKFNLSDYKVPDLKRQGVDILFDLKSSLYNNHYKDSAESYFNENNFSNLVHAEYFFYLNNERYQGNHKIRIYNSIGKDKAIQENHSKESGSKNSVSLYYNSTNFIYFKNLYFFGVSPLVSTSFYQSKSYMLFENNQLSSDEHKTSNSRYSYFNLPISVGLGRIERIDDARHALYILAELKRSNRLKREPTEAEILEFAKIISETKNERVLDARLKKIYELNQIDSILNKMDLIPKIRKSRCE